MLLRCGRTVIVSSGQRWATWIAQRLSHNQRPFFASLSHIKLALFQSFSSVLFFVPFTSGRLSWHCLCKTWRVECSSPARKRQRNTSCTWWVGPQTEDVEIAVQNKFFLITYVQCHNSFMTQVFFSAARYIVHRLRTVRSTLALTKRMVWSASTTTLKNTTILQCSTKSIRRWESDFLVLMSVNKALIKATVNSYQGQCWKSLDMRSLLFLCRCWNV